MLDSESVDLVSGHNFAVDFCATFGKVLSLSEPHLCNCACHLLVRGSYEKSCPTPLSCPKVLRPSLALYCLFELTRV